MQEKSLYSGINKKTDLTVVPSERSVFRASRDTTPISSPYQEHTDGMFSIRGAMQRQGMLCLAPFSHNAKVGATCFLRAFVRSTGSSETFCNLTVIATARLLRREKGGVAYKVGKSLVCYIVLQGPESRYSEWRSLLLRIIQSADHFVSFRGETCAVKSELEITPQMQRKAPTYRENSTTTMRW